MKEIKNLIVKNPYFREIDYLILTDEIKRTALPLLIFIVYKHNSDLKIRGCTNGSLQ